MFLKHVFAHFHHHASSHILNQVLRYLKIQIYEITYTFLSH